MKKNIIFGAIAALMLTSCIGDLDQMPLADNVVGGVYENPTLRKSALAKVYGGFSLVGQGGAGSTDIDVNDAGASELVRALWSVQTLSTDEAKCVWGDDWVADINGNKWSSVKNNAIYAVYTRSMMIVAFANDFLRNTTDNDPEIAIERAEVRFIRAYAYWLLLDCFGNPPFVLEDAVVGVQNPKQIASKDLFVWLKGELEALVSENSALKAPHTQVYPRVDKGAAYGLLARLCLNHKTYIGEEDSEIYAAAAAAADEVIAAYPLAENYNALFMGDNGENPDALNEIVYATCYDANKTQSYGGTSFLIIAGQDTAHSLGIGDNWNGLVTSTEAVKVFNINTDAAKLPVTEKETVVDEETGEEKEVEKIIPGDGAALFTQTDKRALVSLEWSSEKEIDCKTFVNGWHVAKYNNNRFLDPETDYADLEKFSSIDFPLIRAGEMYLVYAEAMARKDGGETSDEKAVEYMQTLQRRAAMASPTVTGTTVSLNQIFDEISREMFWEGQRRTTLIRFDKYSSADYLWPFKGGVENGQPFSKHLELFPIPSDDRLANPNLEQNPGYNN